MADYLGNVEAAIVDNSTNFYGDFPPNIIQAHYTAYLSSSIACRFTTMKMKYVGMAQCVVCAIAMAGNGCKNCLATDKASPHS